MPKFTFDQFKKLPDVLTVELVKPKPPEPVIEKIQPVEPVKVEPIKPKEIKPKKPKTEPIKKLAEQKPEPKTEPVKAEPAPEAKPEPKPQPEQQVPEVIAEKPNAEEKPVFVAPKPQPEQTNDEDFGAAKKAFLSDIQKEFKQNLRYPKMAEKRGISGAARVEVFIDNEGNVTAAEIIETSGNDSLDAEAIAVIKRSDLKKYMNEKLFGKVKSFKTRVQFTINEQ